MEPGQETDTELEQRARAQAEAIAQYQALLQQSPMQLFFKAVGKALHMNRPEDEPPAVGPKPGRELLLWQMKEAPDALTAFAIAFRLFEESKFKATIPENRECILTVFQARRKWNEAAKEWSAMGGGDLHTWLQCNRKLILRKHAGVVSLHVSFKDLNICFDKKTDKLVPLRAEGMEEIDIQKIHFAIEKFPAITPAQLTDYLRQPTRMQNTSRRGAPDTYIANGPLVASMEVYMHDKRKKKDDKEDPGKGFITWLSSLLKSSAAK